jgi:thiamine kinase-like enzyme
MAISYLGTVSRRDPLYEILLNEVCPGAREPVFHVDQTSSRRVYKYTEEKTRSAIIGKFFLRDDPKVDRIARIKGEYYNLKKVRSYGFDNYPNYVVRPIRKEERIGLALMEEFVQGRDLDFFIKRAAYEGREPSLKDRLSRLASFLFALHSRTGTRKKAALAPVCAYYEKVLKKLRAKEVISRREGEKYLKLLNKWSARGLLESAPEVIVHGDATPTNFLFPERGHVVAIDLERMKLADSVYDLGMVAGELKHAFIWRTGDPRRAEPFIAHFFRSYAEHFPVPKEAFRELTRRNPFYMALAELRIARNSYLDRDYTCRLADEAYNCLKWGLRL